MVLLALAATAADAQSCTITYYGPSAICSPDPVTAMVYAPSGGGYWTSVTWTISAGQFHLPEGGTAATVTGEQVAFSADGSGPVTLTIRGTSSTGCTTPDTVVTVPLSDTPVLTIIAPADACAGTINVASVAPPADGSWYNVNWSIEGGYFWPHASGSNMGESVQFVPWSSPTILYAYAQHTTFCQVAPATASVAIRTPDAPVVDAPPEMCMNTMATVSLAAPPSEGTWAQMNWTIENGYFVVGTYNYYTSIQNTGEPVTITPSGSGPVIIRTHGYTSTGCWSEMGETTVPIRTPAMPVVTAPAEVCSNTPSTATISAPEQGSWTSVNWSITNGYFRDQYGSYVTSLQNTGEPVTFEVTSGMTATISAGGQESTGCWNAQYGSATVASRAIAAPVVTAPAELCPNSPGTATVAPPAQGSWSRVMWSIDGGSFVDQYGNRVTFLENGGQPVTFEVSSPGPARIYVGAQDSEGCWTPPGDATIVNNRTVPAPAVTAPAELCPNSPGTATVAPPAEGTWSRVMWSIDGGSFVDQYGNRVNFVENSGQPVTFEVSSPGPARIYVGAQDSFGCWTPPGDPAIVANRRIPAPAVSAPAELCPGSPGTATVAQPAEGTWTRVLWSIDGGSFLDQYGNRVNFVENSGQPVTFEVSSPGPARIYVGAQDSFGCWTPPGDPAIVVNRTIPAPAVTAPAELCPGSPGTATVAPPAEGTWTRVLWSIDGGSFVDQYGNRVNFMENSGQPVTFEVSAPGPARIYVGAQDSFGCWTTPGDPAIVANRTIPAPAITAPAELCPRQPGTASLSAPAEGSWVRVQWSISGGSFVDQYGNRVNSIENSGQPVTFELTGEGAATISAGAQDGLGCWTPPSQTTVAVAQLPAESIVLDNDTVCLNSTRNASIAGTWQDIAWSITGGTLTSSANATTVSFLATESTVTLSVTAAGTSGCVMRSSRTITVTSHPSPEISVSTSTLCLNTPATATVTNNPPYAITWSIAGGTIIGSATGTSISFSANGTGPVTLTATPDGCASPASVTVPVHPTSEPSITASHAMPFCPGTAVTLTASEGASWSWSTGATTRSIVITAAGTYRVSITDANGCVRETAFTAEQAATPEVAVVAAGPTRFCEGGSVVLTPDVDQPGATYLWSNGATTRSITATQADSYSVTVTFASGCSKTSAPVTVTVDPLPEAVITADNNAICNTNTGVRLTANAGGDSYRWSNGQTTSWITVTQPGDYTVTVTKNGCSKTSAPFTVIPGVFPSEAPIPAEYWVRACPNGTATASLANPNAFARIEWSIDDGQIVGPNDQPTVTFRVNSANTTVRVRGYSETSCSYTNNVNVLVGLPPSDFSAPQRICLGNSTRSDILQPQDEATYTWAIEGGRILMHYSDRPGIAWEPTGSSAVTITATATRDGCSTTTTKTIQVDALAASQVRISAPSRVCTVSGHTATAADAGEGAVYTWYMISGGTITSDPNQRSITYDVDPGAPYTRMTLSVRKGACQWYISHDTVYDVPQAAITASSTTVCPGGSTTLTATQAASYRWSTGATTRSITVTAPGDYTVTTTSQGGCSTTSAPMTIAAETASAPDIDLSPDAVCWSQTDVTAVVANASQFTSISWTTNATATTPLTGSSIGVRRAAGETVYWVEATGTTANGCQLTTRVEIPVDAKPATTITAADAFCDGGTYTLSVPDAGPGATYQWRISHGTILSGANSPTMTMQAAANGQPLSVFCDITEPRGCVSTGEKVIQVSANPTVDITADASSCAGKVNTAAVPAIAGATYQWSVTNGEIVSGANAAQVSFRGTSAGTLTLQATVTANGCSTTDTHTMTIEQYTSTITASGPTEFCYGSSVTLTADGPDTAAYAWSNGRTGRSIVVTAPGTYYVDMTLNGCTVRSNSIPVTVNDPPYRPEITASGPLTFCEGGSVTLTASEAAGYSWSNGATTRSITVSEAGTYTVTVYNANGCSEQSNPVEVTVLDAPGTINTWTYGSTTFCQGGSVTIVASGEYGYNFRWSTGATSQSITVTESGTYTVTVTNDAGCTNTSAPITVTVLPTPPKPVVTTSGPTEFCEGGSLTLTAPAGYDYAWSTGETTQSITVQYGGYYTVTVRNAEGCSATSDPVYVRVFGQPRFNWMYYGEVCAGVESSREISLPPDAVSTAWSITNGTITRSENNRVWFIATANPVTLTAAVTGNTGCTYTSSQTLPVNSATTPTITAGGATAFCSGGSVTLTSSPATSYRWSTGATTQSITVSAAGSYTVTTTDAKGCSATSAPTVVTVHDNPSATVTPSGPTTFCAGGSVTLTAPAGYASYLWSNGSDQPSITVSQSGSYTVTVTNANGCSATSAPNVVTVHDNPSATVTPSGPTTFCAGGSVTLTAPAGYATYLWSNGSDQPSITVSQSGSYTVTVTNANGCSATSAPNVVTVHDNPSATVTPSGPTTFCAGGSVTLTAPAGYATYLWSNGSDQRSITVSQSGSYTVTVTNANGCSATSAATAVTVHDNPTATISESGPTAFCAGGSVTLTAPAGYATYLWSNGSDQPSITVSQSGSYTVTVTNANGCSATSAPKVVTVHTNPTATISESGPTTFCGGGSVTLTAPAGYASYLWSNGSDQPSITVSQSGSYTVTVTNANGCSATSAAKTVTVHANPTASISASGPTTFCAGGSVTLTAPAGFASYRWSNGSDQPSITVSQSGSYTVTVTNANGCSTTSAPASVTVNPLPNVPVITASGSTALCPGGSVTLTAPAGYASYRWSNGSDQPSITVSTAGQYTVTVTNANGCSRTSDAVTVSNNPPTVITAQPSSMTIPRGVTRTLTVTATGTPTLQYQWYEGSTGDTTRPITTNGGTTSTLTIGPYTRKGTFRYWVRVSSSTCTGSVANSAAATVTVN